MGSKKKKKRACGGVDGAVLVDVYFRAVRDGGERHDASAQSRSQTKSEGKQNKTK